ncbi:adenylyl-sulfate kinase [Candidatus Woesearchaeota archaeon CG_4_10_14_0_2_um_filter_57_5]|nr:MAG: hypothetical protein AUJ68_02015 [Candidatus Woesearchaeota archaeon CG1_02_57_44]PIN68054.1 MAG: adenylyl-sulfate kinase [Candidatus Woesearchaeota archaeon CG11_big_fil_rev_8_21_14_0_20_57_5]PIZ48407.1 MAG: adenylyl-sulfate kinase [Candidatus Woesearchaeota archaeon CG_4_10_14_0_2_um_filter_57_5]
MTVIWLTGLPGTGKSTIAHAVMAQAKERGEADGLRLLELDAIRKYITPNPAYTEEERAIVYRALATMTYLLAQEGKHVVVDATDNTGTGRQAARELLSGVTGFHVVSLICDDATRQAWEEARGTQLYSRAKAGMPNVPGATGRYVKEKHPSLTIATDTLAPPDAASAIRKLFNETQGDQPT